jgi:hypothetical protein
MESEFPKPKSLPCSAQKRPDGGGNEIYSCLRIYLPYVLIILHLPLQPWHQAGPSHDFFQLVAHNFIAAPRPQVLRVVQGPAVLCCQYTLPTILCTRLMNNFKFAFIVSCVCVKEVFSWPLFNFQTISSWMQENLRMFTNNSWNDFILTPNSLFVRGSLFVLNYIVTYPTDID